MYLFWPIMQTSACYVLLGQSLVDDFAESSTRTTCTTRQKYSGHSTETRKKFSSSLVSICSRFSTISTGALNRDDIAPELMELPRMIAALVAENA